ncbi:DUF6233 domain-containing protein [Streptomyces sp. NPDC057287]|uniref:DUF6233 domain-containing protein n=1 Tax=Streptomyces sp. NPDC057287 TaxID=3346086 RepID=UPI0036451FDB
MEDPAAAFLIDGLAAPGCATCPDQVGLVCREDAMVALAEWDIEPCEVCRPDTGLRD